MYVQVFKEKFNTKAVFTKKTTALFIFVFENPTHRRLTLYNSCRQNPLHATCLKLELIVLCKSSTQLTYGYANVGAARCVPDLQNSSCKQVACDSFR
jgi:hypothetical protein